MRNRKHDIEKYLLGELTPAEMHALEKEALSDPFLAEALEGIEQAGADNFLYDLHKINRSVHDRMRKRSRKNNRTIRMWGWTSAVAATILLIAVSGFLVVQILKDHRPELEESMSTAPQSNPDTDSTDVGEVAGIDSSLLALKDVEKPSPGDQGPAAQKKPLPTEKRDANEQPTDGDDFETETPLAEESDVPASRKAEEKEEEKRADESLARAERSSADSLLATTKVADKALEGRTAGVQVQAPAEVTKRSIAPALRVKGKVTSRDGHGLPGVNVIVEGKENATVTDGEGYFEMIAPADSRLVFSFIGFETQVLPADKPQLNVTMEEDVSSLSEVVVTGYSSQPASDDFYLAEPDGGRTDFKNYLANAVRYPQEAVQNKIEGKVTVQFTVEPSGQLTDFQVVKGIGSGCEEELIRAIQEGPYWKPSKRGQQPVKDKVRVRFKFNLPK